MEGNAVSLTHHSDISTHPEPSDAETDSPTSIQPNQRHMKPIESSDQWTRIHEEISTLKVENTRLMHEKEDLKVDLEVCQVDLFRRMPPTQISDDSIRKALERIHGSIDEFVFEIMGDVGDDALYNLCQRKLQKQKQKQKRRKSQNLLSTFINKEDISVWGPYDCSNFYILSVIIQCILDTFVFGEKYPMGITKEQIGILEEVARGMWHAKKQERLDVWTSETMTALTVLRENETRLEEASKTICDRLNNILSPWLCEAGPFAKVEERFRREILDPAIKLHQDLRSSSHRYETRHIKVFDRISPKQMLDEWDLKDADTWQKARGEKGVGKALYCLHPSLVRLRTKGTPPIVVAKPVIVVISPARERISNPRGLNDSSLSGMTAPPATIEPIPATDQVVFPLNQESPAQIKFAHNPSTLTDSDSTADSRSRRLSSKQRRASTHPFTQKHEYPSGPPQRRLSVPVESSHVKEDRPGHSKSHLEEERQSSGRPREDQDIPLYTRGHSIAGSSFSHRSQGPARQPSMRPSRDTSNDRSSPRRSANENSQPSIAPSTPVPSTPSGKPRGLRERFFPRQQ